MTSKSKVSISLPTTNINLLPPSNATTYRLNTSTSTKSRVDLSNMSSNNTHRTTNNTAIMTQNEINQLLYGIFYEENRKMVIAPAIHGANKDIQVRKEAGLLTIEDVRAALMKKY